MEYDPADPTVAAIEDIEWELIDALDTLVIHVLALHIPELKAILDKLGLEINIIN